VVEARFHHLLRNPGRRAHTRIGQGFTSTKSTHVKEIVKSAQEGGASLGILSGFVAGNFSAYWLGLSMVALMGLGYYFSTGASMADQMLAPAVFAFGLVAFGFLGMGPVTIAVDSYGPVTDNAQSVYELSLIEDVPGIEAELKKDYNIDAKFERCKHLLEANDGAGNTFKATAKPVLIGTAVVGATTMTFSIIMALTHGLTDNVDKLSLLHAPFHARAHLRWCGHLLVRRRFHTGGLHGRLPRSRVHQAEHQPRKLREGIRRRQ
jgi:K(+)-stimulated pyrophosphate-energized sodium pump